MREVKKYKSMKSGSGTSKKSTYIHFSKLTFLQNSIGQKDTESNFSTENESLDRSTTPETNTTFSSPNETQHTRASKKIKLHPADERFATILEQSLVQRQLSTKKEDENKLFCLSLNKEIKKVPENRRLKLKIDIFNLILQHQTTPPHQPELPSNFNVPSVSSPPSTGYFSASHGQQYMQNPGYPYGSGSTTPTFNTQSYHPRESYHGQTSSMQGTAATPSPAPTNISDVSQESELDCSI